MVETYLDESRMKHSLLICFWMLTFAGGPQAIAQVKPSTNAQTPVNVSSEHDLTRAEVKADLAVWKRAGMERFWNKSVTPDIYSREYKMAQAEYLRMRNGPEYQEELQRQQQ